MAIIILAGGRGTRIGRPKATLSMAGETLLNRTVRQWHAVLPYETIITVGPEEYGCQLPDTTPDLGPLGGLVTGLRASPDEVNLVTGCDQPFLSQRLPSLLTDRLGSYEVCLAEYEGYIQPFPGAYRRTLHLRLDGFLAGGERRWRSFLALCNCKILQEELVRVVDPHMESFTNINTPLDWMRISPQHGVE
ncbi:MAG: molybdenum cofactor guanylyltransferase [Bacillota bacterium]